MVVNWDSDNTMYGTITVNNRTVDNIRCTINPPSIPEGPIEVTCYIPFDKKDNVPYIVSSVRRQLQWHTNS